MYNEGTTKKAEVNDSMEPTKYSLKELRARKNKTQKEVAADLGISTTTYCAWESDVSNVAISKVLALAEYFGVALGQISFSP